MYSDDLKGIERFVLDMQGKQITSGKVVSISSSRAIVNIGSEVNTQSCAYDPSSPVNPGDEVILIKPPRSQLWSIVAVTLRKQAGVANPVRVTPNKRVGGQKFASGSSNGGGSSQSVTSASAQLVNSQEMTFNGGRAMIVYNGSASIASGSSLLTMQAGLDGSSVQVYLGEMATAARPVNFTWISSTPLFGTHSVEVYALKSSANISLTNYQFDINEL